MSAVQRERIVELCAGVALAILATALLRPGASVAQSFALAPSTMPRIDAVSERYQSYNVETIEVTGGRFWKPYRPAPDRVVQQGAPPTGIVLSGGNWKDVFLLVIFHFHILAAILG